MSNDHEDLPPQGGEQLPGGGNDHENPPFGEDEQFPEWVNPEDDAAGSVTTDDFPDLTQEKGVQQVHDTEGNSIEVNVGYALKPGVESYPSADGKSVPSVNFTHKDALRLMDQDPAFFRSNVNRSYYAVDDSYWT